MADLAGLMLTLLGVAIVGAVARFGWEVSGGLARRVQHQLWPSKKEFQILCKSTRDGSRYWAVYDDWGRLIFVERAPDRDEAPAPSKGGAPGTEGA